MKKVLSSIVISGKGKGKKLGFPTVNILLEEEMESGVYSGKVFVDGIEYKAGIYINRDEKILEAHLLDFSRNLRGKEIEIEIGKRIRDVRKFDSDEDLKAQIKKDIEAIKISNF